MSIIKYLNNFNKKANIKTTKELAKVLKAGYPNLRGIYAGHRAGERMALRIIDASKLRFYDLNEIFNNTPKKRCIECKHSFIYEPTDALKCKLHNLSLKLEDTNKSKECRNWSEDKEYEKNV